MRRFLLYAWVAPTSLLGLAFLPFARLGGGYQLVDGVLEIHGGLAGSFLHAVGAWAMTLGHVVLGADQLALDLTRSHERIHVRQAERWGPLFVPAYLLAGACVWMRGGSAYRSNPFEREAYGD